MSCWQPPTSSLQPRVPVPVPAGSSTPSSHFGTWLQQEGAVLVLHNVHRQ